MPDFDGFDPGAGPGGGDMSGLGCGWHLVLISVLVLMTIGLMKWIG
ncbi:MAG: hypothetical protein AAGD11_07050 [Planctomycetota bacterium]